MNTHLPEEYSPQKETNASFIESLKNLLQQSNGKIDLDVSLERIEATIEAISNDTLFSCEQVFENGLPVGKIRIVDPNTIPITIHGGAGTDSTLTADYYKAYDSRYRLVYEHGGERFEMKKCNPEIRFLTEQAILRPHMSVVDLGCGEGRDSLELARIGQKNICAVDISEAALSKLSEDLEKESLANVQVVQGDLTDLNTLAAEAFDFALSMGALHMLVTHEHRQKHLQEALRILKPGGLFLIKHSREWLKGFRTVVWTQIQQTMLRPGDIIPRRIWSKDGTNKIVDLPILPHRVARPDELIEEVLKSGFELETELFSSQEGGFGNSFSILFRKP